jgi:hypothetical protein
VKLDEEQCVVEMAGRCIGRAEMACDLRSRAVMVRRRSEFIEEISL